MTAPTSRWTRRQFVAQAATLTVVPLLLPATVLGRQQRPAPSERIRVGVIGLGSRGFNLLESFLAQPDVDIVALCDVDKLHYRDLAWGKGKAYGREPAREFVEKQYAAATKSGRPPHGLAVTADYREVCQRDDIDAVVVATPDHWHAFCTLTALRAGKDVYCEKPVTHFFHEGQAVYREVAQRQAIFQTGSQQRSEDVFRRAVELVRNGVLGDLQRIEVGLPPGYTEPMGDATVQSPPEGLDYDLWCGPSPVLPYMRARHHRWWRGHRVYGGGVLMDWIGHHNDIAHWSMDLDKSGPRRIEAVGWEFPATTVYNTPAKYAIRCEYDNGVVSTISSEYPIGTKWIGADGWLYVTRSKLQASDSRWLRDDFPAGPQRLAASSDHTRNFLDGVKSRRECIAPAEAAHRSITPGHLGYVSYALGRPLNWDPATETVVRDPEANRLLAAADYRSPWTLEAT